MEAKIKIFVTRFARVLVDLNIKKKQNLMSSTCVSASHDEDLLAMEYILQRSFVIMHTMSLCDLSPVESKALTYHGRVGSGRTAGRRGGAGYDGTPTEHFALGTSVPRTTLGIEGKYLERFSRSTNNRNPM